MLPPDPVAERRKGAGRRATAGLRPGATRSEAQRSSKARHEQAGAPPELLARLAKVALFSDVDPASFPDLAAELEWFCIPGGTVLFTEGQEDRSLYVLLSGRLGAFIRDDAGRDRLVRRMDPGETVGEMAMLSGLPRSATVLALRDSEVIRMSQAAFDQFMVDHPRSIHAITGILIQRLREGQSRIPPLPRPGTIAIFPAEPGLPVRAFASSLAESIAALGSSTLVVDRDSADHPTEWFGTVEESNDLVVYVADGHESAWARQCLRQADRVILLADAASDGAKSGPAFDLVRNNPRKAPIELVLHRGRSDLRARTRDYVVRLEDIQHHHLAADSPRDFRHLARMLTGRAVGLVLSGGGARSFSQIGVLKALHEAGIEVDLFGGTSMGAIVAGAAAMGWDIKSILQDMQAAFGANPLRDYTLPLVSLVRGRRTAALLSGVFGSARIEDCRYPFYCVSANLSTGRQKVHRSGPMTFALQATSAIPGILPPMIENSEILIDGAMLNNLPIDVMVGMRRGPIVAVDVTSAYALTSTIDEIHSRSLWQLLPHARRGTPNILKLLVGATAASSLAQTKALRHEVALLIEPPLNDIGLLDWGAFERAVEIGYRHTLALLETEAEWVQPRATPPSTSGRRALSPG